jgi:hypothetical protein
MRICLGMLVTQKRSSKAKRKLLSSARGDGTLQHIVGSRRRAQLSKIKQVVVP